MNTDKNSVIPICEHLCPIRGKSLLLEGALR